MGSKKLEIKDNDAYVLAQSKSYIIINDNYQGINIYDHELNFLNAIKVSEELMIYNLYSSKKNDRIVLFDAENMKLYLVDLYDPTDIIPIDTEAIFLEWFKSETDWFALRDASKEYRFSFRDGKAISYSSYDSIHMLSYRDEDILIEENSRLYLLKDNEKIDLNKNYEDNKFYTFSEKWIVEYTENSLLVEKNDGRRESIEVDTRWMIRKVLIEEDKLTILLNAESRATKNELIRCPISDIGSLKFVDNFIFNNE